MIKVVYGNLDRISICARCEKELTGALVHAFGTTYKVDLEYCGTHRVQYMNERRVKGLCLSCDHVKVGQHDRGCSNDTTK